MLQLFQASLVAKNEYFEDRSVTTIYGLRSDQKRKNGAKCLILPRFGRFIG